MILFRYLAKEVLVSTAAVSLILLLIIISGRFVSYLGRAAEGKMTFEFLFIILGFHIPSFAQMILPLAFFLSLLLAYGRLYVENEMSILFSCGVSKLKLTGYTLGIASIVMILNAILTFWIAPASEYQVEQAAQQQNQLTAFDFVKPGRFQGRGQKTTYVASLTPNEGWMNDVFISDFIRMKGQDIPVQTLASYVEQVKIDDEGGRNYLIFKEGTRYEGTPGTSNYKVTSFDTYAVRLEDTEKEDITDIVTRSTRSIWNSSNLEEYVEMQWRIAIVVMIPILAVIGVALSHVNPRQGRFFKLLPAIVLVIIYLGMLIWARTALDKGTIPSKFGLWWVHGIFLTLAIMLLLQFIGFTFTKQRKHQ
ncbi:LPS export ABC transporter permease LptF [Marinomonas sp. 15G1-11]|uniref:Lipopolysaccharide export system permease protein LptF n=1 Tax=Marinomonas phaeophyticola TaxID=3004091 RepID=A0ABT4JZ63_9GAMM|nr:LPS export ABC transporter permease LptF [Marinomonas sp. 15G1-11]MCZ2723521.1 LPS export ABC transporter permease LptF [Marinomonas sp. 15G1-11]